MEKIEVISIEQHIFPENGGYLNKEGERCDYYLLWVKFKWGKDIYEAQLDLDAFEAVQVYQDFDVYLINNSDSENVLEWNLGAPVDMITQFMDFVEDNTADWLERYEEKCDEDDEDEDEDNIDWTNKEQVLVEVSQDGNTLEYASEELKADKDVVLAAVSQDGRALKYAVESLKDDKEVVIAAVAESGSALKYISESLWQEKEVLLAAVSEYERALQYVDASLKEDKDVTKILMETRAKCQMLDNLNQTN